MTTIVLHNRKLGSESIVRCSCKALAVFDLKRKCAGCLGSRIKVKYVDLIAELDNHKYTLTGLALNFITYGYTNEPEDRLRSLEELAQTDHLELNSSAFYESGSGVIRSDIDLVVAIPSKATHIAFHCSDNEDASQLLHVVTTLFRSKVGLRQVTEATDVTCTICERVEVEGISQPSPSNGNVSGSAFATTNA